MISNVFSEDKKAILTLFKKKEFKKVIKLGKKLTKKYPEDFQLLYALGLSFVNLQNYTDAENCFKKILLFRKTAEILYNYGNIQSKLKNYKKAINSFNEAISLNPNFSEAYNSLGVIKKLINENEEAIQYYKKAIATKNDNISAYFNLAIALKDDKKYEACKTTYEKILEIDKFNFRAKHDLGTINSVLGNFKVARKYYKEALKENNEYFKSYKNYIEITKIDKEDNIFKKLEKIKINNLSDQNKIDLFYSLSKGYFDQQQIKIGFKYLEKAKQIKKNISNYSINNQKKLFKKIKIFFDIHHQTNIRHNKEIKNKPIFIIGMPRSGTTLIEQILSSHSKIYGAGELTYLPQIMDHINIDKDSNFKDIISKIRSEYHEKLVKLSNKSFIIDKLPMNFKWIGFIIKAFPEATLIHLERNPMAVCWSNYKINFNNTGMNFTLSQEDIAEYYTLYDDLMKYWFKIFDKKIINVNYETFVLDHEREIKRILDKSNLAWEDGIKNYNDNSRAIETASLHQARGKIFKNSSQQWKNYQDYLKPTQDILKANKINY